jgi:hypothetical protein
MTQTDILNYIGEGGKWLVIGGAGVMGYYYTLWGLQFLSAISPFNEKIKSKEHLERVVGEEAKKLGLDSSKIDVKYSYLGDTYCDKKKEGHVLVIDSGLNCTRGSVKHELCHINNRDCERKKEKDLYYYLVAEPRAILYEVFGLRFRKVKNKNNDFNIIK